MYRWCLSIYTENLSTSKGGALKTSNFIKPVQQVFYNEDRANHYGGYEVWESSGPGVKQPKVNAAFVDGHARTWLVSKSGASGMAYDANWFQYPVWSTNPDPSKGWDVNN
jgi:prepilin-type processing-associated H-X9-DG protein